MCSRVSRKSKRPDSATVCHGMRLSGMLFLLGMVGAAVLRGQDPREALVARAFREFDATRRLELLMSALNPTSGPPRGAWSVGAQLLAQTLIEDGRDSAAAVWLRWAIRLAPDLQPDTVQFLPEVITAYRSAQDFVSRTRGVADASATTTWLWAAPAGDATMGRIQIVTSGPVPVRVEVGGVGLVGERGSLRLNPIRLSAGSYQIRAAAAGLDSIRVMREVLPGVTTIVELHLRPVRVQVATTRPPSQPLPSKKKGFPVVWAGVGAAGAVGLAAFLITMGAESAPSTGSIVVTFPGP
jgi:hypothetical protein